MLQGGLEVAQLDLGPISPATAARIKADTGIDVSGMHLSIDTNQIRHAWNGHGPGNERDPSQIPIDIDALAISAAVVEDYDRITSVRQGKQGTTIEFEKDIDGVTVVVQQVRSKQGRLGFFTMWIRRATQQNMTMPEDDASGYPKTPARRPKRRAKNYAQNQR